jgi:hypothetical protein
MASPSKKENLKTGLASFSETFCIMKTSFILLAKTELFNQVNSFKKESKAFSIAKIYPIYLYALKLSTIQPSKILHQR